jgi:conjugative transfer region protein (TIGR03750 family)
MQLNHINHPVPIYHNCTLMEMLLLFAVFWGMSLIVLPLLLNLLWGKAFLGVALSLMVALLFTRIAMRQLGQLKQGKPYGYYQQRLRLHLQQAGVITLPIILRAGPWSIERE